MDAYSFLAALLGDGTASIPTPRRTSIGGANIETAGHLAAQISHGPGTVTIAFSAPKPKIDIAFGVTATIDQLDLSENAATARGTGPFGVPVSRRIVFQEVGE